MVKKIPETTPIKNWRPIMPKVFNGCFLFLLTRMKSPTPAPVESPATRAGKLKTPPSIYNSTSKTEEAQLGINPTKLAIRIWI